MSGKDFDTYYNCINGKDARIGSLVMGDGKIGIIVGMTKTQFKCHELENDVETVRKWKPEFNVTKDKGYGGGGVIVGSRAPYGGKKRVRVHTKEEALEFVKAQQEKQAIKREKAAKLQTEYEAKVEARKELMRAGYEARLCLNEELGVYSMSTVNEEGRQVLITWRSEWDEEPDWTSKEMTLKPVVRVSMAYWHQDVWGGQERVSGPASTSANGPDELTALASRSYD